MPLPIGRRMSSSSPEKRDPQTQQTSSTSSFTSQSAQNAIGEQQRVKMFHEKLAILNENFVRFVSNSVKERPAGDFTPTLKDYLKHLEELDRLYASPEQGADELLAPGSSMAAGAKPTEVSLTSSIMASSGGAASSTATIARPTSIAVAQTTPAVIQQSGKSGLTATTSSNPTVVGHFNGGSGGPSSSSSSSTAGQGKSSSLVAPSPTPAPPTVTPTPPTQSPQQTPSQLPSWLSSIGSPTSGLPKKGSNPTSTQVQAEPKTAPLRPSRKRQAPDDPWMEMQRRGGAVDEEDDRKAGSKEKQQPLMDKKKNDEETKDFSPGFGIKASIASSVSTQGPKVPTSTSGGGSGGSKAPSMNNTSPLAIFSTSNPEIKTPSATATSTTSPFGSTQGNSPFASFSPFGSSVSSTPASSFQAQGGGSESSTATTVRPPTLAEALKFQPNFPADQRKDIAKTGEKEVAKWGGAPPSSIKSTTLPSFPNTTQAPNKSLFVFGAAANTTTVPSSTGTATASSGAQLSFTFNKPPTIGASLFGSGGDQTLQPLPKLGDALLFGGGGAGGAKQAPAFSFNAGAKLPVFGQAQGNKEGGDGEEGDDGESVEPPKPESVEQVEEDALCSLKCSVFGFDAGKFEKRGVGYVSVKELAKGSSGADSPRQLIVRAATTLGTIWTNTKVNEKFKCEKMDATRLRISYPATKPKDAKNPAGEKIIATETMLIRVQSAVEMEKLISAIGQDGKR